MNGKSCIFDTSIFHSTENMSDRVRYVLLIRFWHPDLTQDEIDAFKMIFDFLDHAACGEEALADLEFKMLMGKDNHAGLQVNLPKKNLVPKKGGGEVASKNDINSHLKNILKKSEKLATTKGFGAKRR